MPSHVRITMGRPFSVFDKNGRLVSESKLELVIPFDDDGAHAARQEIAVQALDGLPPGFAHVATHVVAGEVVIDADSDSPVRADGGHHSRVLPGPPVRRQDTDVGG